ncbi:MAG: hypothetical protein EPN21_03320 [Methylococcaceae bacterium]|nr:MAG: hypothetical protein EPN21_03320 [Methylococcaceae bacterium]
MGETITYADVSVVYHRHTPLRYRWDTHKASLSAYDAVSACPFDFLKPFLAKWQAKTDIYAAIDDTLWLEFDVGAKCGNNVVPNLFFSIGTANILRDPNAICRVLADFNVEFSAPHQAKLSALLNQTIQPHAVQFGVMFGRAGSPIRACFFYETGKHPISTSAWFKDSVAVLGYPADPFQRWCDDLGALPWLSHLSAIDVDLTSSSNDRLGFEFGFLTNKADHRGQKADAKLWMFLAWLQSMGLLAAPKQRMLEHWIGATRLVAATSGITPSKPHNLVRTINHFKLDVYTPYSVTAKAYLNFDVIKKL